MCCRITEKTDSKTVQNIFASIFREYGLPEAIRTDNGPPFASRGIAGLTPLSVWWLKLGIRLERIEPGKPAQNGRHERMHRTLKQETALPPRSSLKEQQKAFDRFQFEYNFERPHMALKNQFPSQLYRPSKKQFPERLLEASYPTNMEVYRIGDMGFIRLGTNRVHISPALRNELVGLEEIDDRYFRIHLYSSVIGIVDGYSGRVLQYTNPKTMEDECMNEDEKLIKSEKTVR